MLKPKLTVVITSRNNAQTLEGCLHSVSWVDEIILIDMGSRDATLAIAKKFGAKVYNIQPSPYVEPTRKYGISLVRSPWVLFLDPDEVLPPLLSAKIKEILEKNQANVSGYRLARKNIIFGQWIENAGWWPDFQLRLFQPQAIEWSDRIHAQPKVLSGQIVDLPATSDLAIIHCNYVTLDEYYEKVLRYTKIEVEQRKSAKIEPSLMLQAFSHEFLRRLFAQKGYLDKTHGLALSFLQAQYELLVVLRQWEHQGFSRSKFDSKKILESLGSFRKELGFWLLTAKIERASGLPKLFWRFCRLLGF